MLLFTDTISKNAIAINPEYVVALFTSLDGEYKGKTVISVTNGAIIVDEEYTEVLGQLQGVK